MECYLVINSNKIVPLVEVWINLESVIQSELSQKEEKKILYNIAYMWTQEKMVQMNWFSKQK